VYSDVHERSAVLLEHSYKHFIDSLTRKQFVACGQIVDEVGKMKGFGQGSRARKNKGPGRAVYTDIHKRSGALV